MNRINPHQTELGHDQTYIIPKTVNGRNAGVFIVKTLIMDQRSVQLSRLFLPERKFSQRKNVLTALALNIVPRTGKVTLIVKRVIKNIRLPICPNVVPLLTATETSYEPLVYPVVVVDVEGEKCRALVDTGAGSSYASAALGASDYLCIKTDEPSRVGNTGDPVAEKTKFGWTIIAKGNEIDYTALLLAQTSQRDYEQFCPLDVLEIADHPEHDQTDVYTEFREQLVKNNQGWYNTGLPCKGNHPTLPSNKNGSLRRLNTLTRKLTRHYAFSNSHGTNFFSPIIRSTEKNNESCMMHLLVHTLKHPV